ncbi:CHAT domain-containing tetratricopeptide repeat protein [Bacteroides acidifaciens]|uniref:CHAT domain-containing protein n=1 Tax=Bacteroides acidifaciens TaxID=85831 RepID=UPI0025583159|nr:CHAT domain-containing tetratricopeptide repeat protein [Bacteroides acidifaciens]
MSFIINKVLITLFLTLCSTLNLWSQNDYVRHLEIMSQANTLARDKKIDEAISILRQNKDLFQCDSITQFWYNWLNGVILYQTDKYSDARPYIVDAISFLDANQNELSDPNLTRFLQIYYYAPDIDYKLGANKNTLVKGLEHAKNIYEIAGATSDPVYSWIISDLNAIQNSNIDVATDALNLFMAGDYVNAIPLLQNAIGYYKSNRPTDYVHLAAWLKSLGMAYMYVGDYQNSEKTYASAIQLLESHNLQNEKAYRIILDAVAVLYIQLQNYEKALAYNTQAKTLYEKALDFGDDYVRCVSNCALSHHGLGHNTTARMMLNVALRQAKQNLSDTTSLSSSLTDLIQLSDKKIDSKSLDSNFFIQTRIRPYITLLSNSSVVYSELGYFPDALRAIKEAIRVSEEYGLKEPLPYNNMGMLYFYKSKFPQSTEWFFKGYDLSKTPYESDEIGMNTALGLFLSKDKTASNFSAEVSAKMRHNIQDMFAFMSGAERATYWKHFENYLPMLNLIIYDGGITDNFGAIYDNILESKGLLLRSTNAIRDAILDSGNKEDIENYVRIGQLKQQLLVESDTDKRSALETEIENLDKKLTQQVNSYANFKASKNIQWQAVRDALSKDDVAIEFYNIPILWGLDSIQTMDGEPRYCALILRKDYKYPHIVSLFKESQLEGLDREDLYETDSIYNLIWKPLESELKGVKNIYFSADRELHKIGIEYAPVSEKENIADRYNLYRLSSTRVLAENKNKSKKESAVLYGGLKYDLGKYELIAESRSGEYHPASATRAFSSNNTRYGVKYLPGTLKEVEEISHNFSKTPQVITDVAGTEESFKTLAGTSTDIIHLATHGFFWTDEDAKNRSYVTFLNPNNKAQQSNEDNALMRSGLFFSGANIGLKGESLPDDVEDGVLTALELSNMNLGNVDMVVMSACQSGLGETSGEGVFGLQRGFKLAGANTLLMSLWQVDDAATQKLMTEFYRNYLSGKSKHESLRLAQKSLRDNHQYSDPEYWAAFILLDALN